MNHDFNKIDKLEFPYNIRTRMGMFGADGITPDILLREAIDNTVDLVLKTKIPLKVDVLTNRSSWNMMVDNGPGLPVYLDKDYTDRQQPITVDLLTKVNVGSNFAKTRYSLGMNGTGLKLVSALSEYSYFFINTVKQSSLELPDFVKNSKKPVMCISFHKGIIQPIRMLDYSEIMVEETTEGLFPKTDKQIQEFFNNVNEEFGTLIVFKPEATLFEKTNISYHGYPFKLIQTLFPYDKDFNDIKIDFTINGKTIEPFDFKSTFKEEFLEDTVLTDAVTVKTDDALPLKFIYQVGWSLKNFMLDSEGSVNLLKTSAGKHISIVQSGISQAFMKYNSLIGQTDSRFGMRLFVLNFAINPLFNSQDKTKLSKWEDVGYNERATIQAISESFYKIMLDNKAFFDLVCARIIEYKKATNKLSNLELLKSKIILGDEGDKRRAQMVDSAKIYDSTSTEWSKRELYIAEGLSAVSNILQVRSKLFQSILPLRGKLINTSGFNEEKLVSNKEVVAIINTIGCGIGGIVDISKSRYGKIIIATDSDSDGCHIANLITGLFVQHCPELVKAGMLYKLESPFYRVSNKKGEVSYFYHEEKDKIDFENCEVTKLKGLGSSNLEETEKFLINPKTRRLIQINYDEVLVDSVNEAVSLLFSGAKRKQLMIDAGILTETVK